MKQHIKAGFTDYSTLVFIPDSASTDGSGKTGLVAANLTVSGVRVETDNDVTVTDYTASLNDLAALTTAHTDWGLKEVSSTLAPGLYRLDIADAIFASGAWTAVVYVMVTTSAAAASPMEFVLVAYDQHDGVRLGLTALPNAAADAAGGLVISDAGGLDADAQRADVAAILVDTGTTLDGRLPAALVGGRMDSSTGAMAANVLTAAAIASDAGTELGTAVWATTTRELTAGTNIVLAKGTGVTGFNDLSAAQVNTEVDTGIADAALATAANLVTVAGYLDTEIAAILADTNELQTDWANGGRLDLILDARASQTSVDTIDDFLDTEIAAIKAKTDNLPADPADASDIAAAFGTVNSTLGAIVGYVDTEVAAIKATTDKLDTALVLDGAVYQFTANALELAPAGGAAPTAAAIADEVETRTIAAVAVVNGLAANTVTAAALAADAVTEIQAGLATAAALADVPTATENADALLTRDWSSVTGEAARSVLNALRAIRNKWFFAGGTVYTVTKEDDITVAWEAAKTSSPSAEPITGMDPT